MKNWKSFISLFSMVLMLSLLASGCSKNNHANEPSAPTDEKETDEASTTGTASELGSLQSFSATTLDGSAFTEEDLAAKDITIINFWSLTCGPCIVEMPVLADFAKSLPDTVQVITVCLDGTGNEEIAQSLLEEAGYEGITLLSGSGDFENVIYNIQYTPTTVLVDSQGNLVGNAIIGGQKDLSGTFLAAVNTALKNSGKAEISLEE